MSREGGGEIGTSRRGRSWRPWSRAGRCRTPRPTRRCGLCSPAARSSAPPKPWGDPLLSAGGDGTTEKRNAKRTIAVNEQMEDQFGHFFGLFMFMNIPSFSSIYGDGRGNKSSYFVNWRWKKSALHNVAIQMITCSRLIPLQLGSENVSSINFGGITRCEIYLAC